MLQHGVDVWENGETYSYKPALYSGDCFRHTIETGELGLFVGSSGLIFQRKTLEKIMPVPLDFRISADAFLTRTSFTTGFVYSIPEALGYYRKHNNAVLDNKSHDHHTFQKNILFPHLNNFYKKRNIDYRYKTRDEIPVGLLTYEQHLLNYLLIKKIHDICTTYEKVAIFGIGGHTKWLSQKLKTIKMMVLLLYKIQPSTDVNILI